MRTPYSKSKSKDSKIINHGTLGVFVKLMVTSGFPGMIKDLEIKRASYAIPIVAITLAMMSGPAIGAYSGSALADGLANGGAMFFDFKRVKGKNILKTPPSHDTINDAIKKYYGVNDLDKLNKRTIRKLKKHLKNFGEKTAVDKHLIELPDGEYEKKNKGYKSGKGKVDGHTALVLYDVKWNIPITWIYTYGSVHESRLILQLMKKGEAILGKGVTKKVLYDKGFYGFGIFKQMIKDRTLVITPAKLYNPTAEKIDEVSTGSHEPNHKCISM